MVLVNLNLLIGYLLIGILCFLITWPVIKLTLLRNKSAASWKIFSLSMALSSAVWFFASMRFYFNKPYFFENDLVIRTIYVFSSGWWPDWLKNFIFSKNFLWIVFALAASYYLYIAIKRFLSDIKKITFKTAAVSTLVIIALCSIGLFAYQYKTRLMHGNNKRPNILLLLSDSLRADHLSVNGYNRKTSPAIDALAEESVNFKKCMTPISSTLESITSIMTGQYPHTHNLRHMFPNRHQVEFVNKHVPAIAWNLRTRGYETTVFGDWCAGMFDIMPFGFEKVDVSHFDNFKIYIMQAVYSGHIVLPFFFDNEIGYTLFPKLKNCVSFVSVDKITEKIKNRITEHSTGGSPFFITAFYSITHLPYRINPPHSEKFTDPKYDGEHKGTMKLEVDKFIGKTDIVDKWRVLPKKDVDQIIGLYDGCVSKFDDMVKEIRDHLKATGMDENTIIVISADHGDDLFEPNCTFGHGLSFNGGDQMSNIPLIIYIPSEKKNAHGIDKIVRSIDIAPTLLELAGLKSDIKMDGVSLMPYIRSAKADMSLPFFGETSYLFYKRYIPGEEPLYIPAMDSTTEIDESFDNQFVLKEKYQKIILDTKEKCLRTERWKLVSTPGRKKEIIRLFDTWNDPHCERPVNNLYPEIVSKMHMRLNDWSNNKKESLVRDIFPQGEPAGFASFKKKDKIALY
jgi:arylsulfatase A-like enzyme